MQEQPLELGLKQQELPREMHQVHLDVLDLRKEVAELGKRLGTTQQGEEPSDRKSREKEVGSLRSGRRCWCPAKLLVSMSCRGWCPEVSPCFHPL